MYHWQLRLRICKGWSYRHFQCKGRWSYRCRQGYCWQHNWYCPQWHTAARHWCLQHFRKACCSTISKSHYCKLYPQNCRQNYWKKSNFWLSPVHFRWYKIHRQPMRHCFHWTSCFPQQHSYLQKLHHHTRSHCLKWIHCCWRSMILSCESLHHRYLLKSKCYSGRSPDPQSMHRHCKLRRPHQLSRSAKSFRKWKPPHLRW